MSRKFSPLPPVTAFVRFDFCLPILLSGLRKTAIAAPVAMPEATVNENHLVAGWEDQVRFAWQIGSVKRVPVAHTVHHSADAHLGASVLGSDTGHDLRSHCRGDSIQSLPPANVAPQQTRMARPRAILGMLQAACSALSSIVSPGVLLL